jgi:glycine cleavage system H lipoate-binding protein
LLNTDPYGEGWIYKIRITGGAEELKSAAQYREQIGG